MNEQMQEILNKLAKRLDLVVLFVLLSLLITTGLLLLQEQNYILPEEPAPQRRAWTVKIPVTRHKPNIPPEEIEVANAAAYEEVREYWLQPEEDINQDPEARRLITVNMFDVKALDEQQAEQQLNQRYNEAEDLFRNGNTDGALALLDSILRQDPNHQESLDLRSRILQNEENQ